MFVVSLNHKKAMAEFREKLSFDDDKRILLLERLKEIGFEQIVYLNTCNRCEIYGVGKASKVISVWADMAGVDIDELKE